MTQQQVITWATAMPNRLAWERTAMLEMAPDLKWCTSRLHWHGFAPVWPFYRARPDGLDEFLLGRRLELLVTPSQAHPAVAPKLRPVDPEPRPEQCTFNKWHVNGDATLCLLHDAHTWSGAEPCAALIPKAAGWFLEYILLSANVIETMTTAGIESSDELDHHFMHLNALTNE